MLALIIQSWEAGWGVQRCRCFYTPGTTLPSQECSVMDIANWSHQILKWVIPPSKIPAMTQQDTVPEMTQPQYLHNVNQMSLKKDMVFCEKSSGCRHAQESCCPSQDGFCLTFGFEKERGVCWWLHWYLGKFRKTIHVASKSTCSCFHALTFLPVNAV